MTAFLKICLSVTFSLLLLAGSAVFAKHTNLFSDISRNHPYYTQIAFFANRGVVSGYPDGDFQPFRLLNRAEAAKIIYRATSQDERQRAKCFKDVKRLQWFSRYVCKNPFIKGYSDGFFRPGRKVTFGEALKMMFVAFTGDYPKKRAGVSGPWYLETMSEAKKLGFIQQAVDGDEAVKRGEFLDMLYRFYGKYREPALLTILQQQATSQQGPQGQTGASGGMSSGGAGSTNPGVGASSGISSGTGASTGTGSGAATGGTINISGNPALAYSKRFADAYALGLQFFENHLSTASGAVFANLGTNYEPSTVVGVNHEVLSESYGLILTALAQARNQTSYEKYFQFLDQRLIDDQKNLVIWKLKEDLTVYQYANAMIDDMRIVKGLLLGFEKFGAAKYRDTALAISNSIKQNGTRNNALVSHVGWNQNENRYFPANHLYLGYGDIATAKKIAQYDPAWNVIHDATRLILTNGQYPSGLFRERYRYDNQSYENDDHLETIFEAYTGEYLAEAGERVASQKLLNFFKNEWTTRRKIVNSYKSDGSQGSSSENIAVYSIISRMAHYLGDREFAEKMGDKVVSLLINKPGSNYHGAFAWSEGDRVYSFNQGNALQALALLATTPSLPPPPPPVIPANQFIVWHMADIYYGPHHDGPCTQMVDDMDTLPWSKAVVAGDISGDGSIQNFEGVLSCLNKADNHQKTDFNIVAGNHEYNCGTTPEDGCLNNYKTNIRPDLFYTWDYGNIHFIMFSPDKNRGDVKDSTFEWIRNEVATHQDKIIVLVNHHMPYLFGNRSRQILDQYGVDLWLFGHAHCKHGDSSCSRHEARGDFYQEAETTFVDAGYIGNMESRYIIFTKGSDQVTIRSRDHEDARFQPEFEHTVRLRRAFDL